MRHIALLLALCAALLSACASEAGNPGPGVNANNWVQPGPDAGSNNDSGNASADAAPQPDQVQGKLPQSVEGKYIAEGEDEYPNLNKISVKLNPEEPGILVYDHEGEGSLNVPADKVNFNEPRLEVVDGDGVFHRWTKEK